MAVVPGSTPPFFRRCQCSPGCPKEVHPTRTYAYGHSPKYKAKEKAPTARGVTYEDKANTTSLDYQMAKRRAQVELPKVEAQIDAIDEMIERARMEVVQLEADKTKLVDRHGHLQALIECADVLTGGPTCEQST